MTIIDETSEAVTQTAWDLDESPAANAGRPKRSLVRRIAMRPRRLLVKVHRWLSFALLAWLVVISLTGAWLVVNDGTGALLNPDRYSTTDGDVGPQVALDNVAKSLPDDAIIYGLALPVNGRGVYQVGAEIPVPGAPEPAEGEEGAHTHEVFYVDPGTGKVNASVNEEEGLTWWLYRGHMYLWQDQGIAGVFNADSGWCRAVDGAEPGGFKGVVCDVIPDGMDMIGWFSLAWIVVLLTGFHLWYWPGVKRWANAFVVRRGRGRFAFHLSLHKTVGMVVWAPLLVVAFTGAAFAFPNMKAWYQNATPAERGMELWVAPDDAWVSEDAEGRDPIGLDGFLEVIEKTYPTRTARYLMTPGDETGTYSAWVTRGFDPWTREGGAGNVLVSVDQYSGKVLYDGTPEDGNTFDQAWDDWSFPLHTGDFGGTITRLLWVVLGLSPILLAVTGVTMWLVRRSKRVKRARAIRANAAPMPEANSVPEGSAV